MSSSVISWIKISDQLPPFRTEVLGLNKDGVRIVEFFTADHHDLRRGKKFRVQNSGMDSCGCCENFDENITHWMLIPTLPEKTNVL